MTVEELINELQKYPKDMKIWVSDNGYCEGATPLKEFKVEHAGEASLDGDEVDDEYIYWDEENKSIEDYLKEGYELIDSKYLLLSKKILMMYVR